MKVKTQKYIVKNQNFIISLSNGINKNIKTYFLQNNSVKSQQITLNYSEGRFFQYYNLNSLGFRGFTTSIFLFSIVGLLAC